MEDAVVSSAQNCGNVLAAVGPFAVDRGLVRAEGDEAEVRIRMVNSGSVAVATFPLVAGSPAYDGDVAISGVPGTGMGVRLDFTDTEGSATGALFPTGEVVEEIHGVRVTCVDNGMPVVLVEAASLGLSGHESVDELAGDPIAARARGRPAPGGRPAHWGWARSPRRPCRRRSWSASRRTGAQVCTRSFIPTHPHTAVGVLARREHGVRVAHAGSGGARPDEDLAGRPDPGRRGAPRRPPAGRRRAHRPR